MDLVMDLVSWSLNAIDEIFSTRRQGEGEPNFSRRDIFLRIHDGLLAEVEDCVSVNNVSQGCRRCVHNWMFDNRISGSTSKTLKADGKQRVGLTQNNSYLNLAPLYGLGWKLCKHDPLPPPFPEDTCGPAQNCVAD
ncbi:hypothetical protein AMECASPLE_033782 [Ameca splendens]|uniref:Uncharacterized protein n=1 Tax=Ameca splendens TaxID=208324 RepID=A0ABV1A2B9_9TELE